jgi:hypothetical protein
VKEMTATDILTALIALYGAGLSTLIALREWKARRPDVHVGLSMGTFDACPGNPTDTMVFLVAANAGTKAATLAWMGFVLPNRSRLTLTDPDSNATFPHKLMPEESCQVWIEATRLAEHLKSDGFSDSVKLIGFYKNVVGRVYKSKPFEFGAEESCA